MRLRLKVMTLFILLLLLLTISTGCHIKRINTTEDLSLLNDEFDNSNTLSKWKRLSQVEDLPNRIDELEINLTHPGNLLIVPSSSAWWKGYHGVLLFKEVDGDFIITTRVRVTGKDSNTPRNPWTLAGIMAREPHENSNSPSHSQENWVYLMAGRGPDKGLVTDFKSTVNGENEWNTRKIKDDWIELRLVRIGKLFVGMYRQKDEDWKVQGKWLREDLSSKLQVGMNVTSDWKVSKQYSIEEYNRKVIDTNHSDLIARYDYIHFERPKLSNNLTIKLNESRFQEITNDELLELFSIK